MLNDELHAVTTIKNSDDMSRTEGVLKVLFVSESYPPATYGGGEISCALMASKLARRDDIEVTVLTSEVEGCPNEEIKDNVTVLRRLRTGRGRSSLLDNLKRKIYFKRSVRREVGRIIEEYDLVHFFNITSIVQVDKPSFATINSYINFCPKGNLFYKEREVCEGCSLCKFLGCITNSDYIGGHKMKGPLKYNPLFWFVLFYDFLKRKNDLQKIEHFFSLSEFINDLLQCEGIEKTNITKVVNIPVIKDTDDELSLDHQGPLAIYVGGLDKIKGVDLLIKAFNKTETDSTLAIVGDGPERRKLEHIAASNVVFLGRVKHEMMHSVYKQADLVIVPSLWPEPLSRVLLEAAYFGKPIIATDVGGSPEVVRHGYNGLLVKPTVKDMKEKLESLLNDNKMRTSMGKNMGSYYQHKLSEEKVLTRIIDSYMFYLHKKSGVKK